MSAWSEEDDRLFEAVSSGDLGAVRSYLAGNGSADPEMVWEPGPDELDESRIAEAARFWDSVRVGDDLPDYSAFVPEDLKPLLGQFISEKNAAYRAAIARRALLFTRHLPPAGSRVTACQRLLMPFARNGVEDILVIANLAFAPDRVRYGPLGESE